MMTPQEVGSHSFARATLGGYNLAMVDEFLDALTKDYTALYNDNAILKGKLKVLSDTLEEYRVTDNAMRKALLSAQKMADEMISDAEHKKDQLVHEAEQAASERITVLRKEIAAEELRLRQAQEATAAYMNKLSELHQQHLDFLTQLSQISNQDDSVKAETETAVEPETMSSQQAQQSAPPSAPEKAPVLEPSIPVPNNEGRQYPIDDGVAPMGGDIFELDSQATKRFENLQFGKDYKIQ